MEYRFHLEPSSHVLLFGHVFDWSSSIEAKPSSIPPLLARRRGQEKDSLSQNKSESGSSAKRVSPLRNKSSMDIRGNVCRSRNDLGDDEASARDQNVHVVANDFAAYSVNGIPRTHVDIQRLSETDHHLWIFDIFSIGCIGCRRQHVCLRPQWFSSIRPFWHGPNTNIARTKSGVRTAFGFAVHTMYCWIRHSLWSVVAVDMSRDADDPDNAATLLLGHEFDGHLDPVSAGSWKYSAEAF